MAANTKGKRKVKGKTVDLNSFLADGQDAPSGFAVVQPRRIDWADTMDNEDLDDRYTLDYKKDDKVVLPTAPKSARCPDVDLAQIPNNPPFTAFLGNLPYDISEEDIVNFFRKLEVKNVRLPRDQGDRGRIKGFGYAEFNTKQDLIQALSLNNESLKSRALKVSLASEQDGGSDRRNAGPDRTLGDWRADRREQFSRDEPSRNDPPRGNFDRDSYRPRSNFDRDFGPPKDRFERNDERSDFGGRSDRDFGRDSDRFERRNDRGYGFSSDRGPSRDGGRDNFRDRRDNFGGRDSFRDNYNRDSGRDMRPSDRDYPPRDSMDRRPPERPSYNESSENRERRKLQLAPRTKPIEPVSVPTESSSSIFGGAKPVDTAAKEREIEERLARERGDPPKDIKDRDIREREKEPDSRDRKLSTGSGNNRSRNPSDSGPTEHNDHVPQYKPPIPRQPEREPPQPHDQVSRPRQRCESNSSTGSDQDHHLNSRVPHPPAAKKEDHNNFHGRNEVFDKSDGYTSMKGGHSDTTSQSQRDNSRDRHSQGVPYEEPKPPVYTSANKFSHLMNDAENVHGSDSE